jgi:hypothetical protein
MDEPSILQNPALWVGALIVAFLLAIAVFWSQMPKKAVFSDMTTLTQLATSTPPAVTQTVPKATRPIAEPINKVSTAVAGAIGFLLFVQAIVLLSVLCSLGLWIWAIVTVATREPPGHDKIVWALITILTGPIGAVIYLTCRYPQLKKL